LVPCVPLIGWSANQDWRLEVGEDISLKSRPDLVKEKKVFDAVE